MKSRTLALLALLAVIVSLPTASFAAGLDLPNDTGELTPLGEARMQALRKGAQAWTKWRAKTPEIVENLGGIFAVPDYRPITSGWSDVMWALRTEVLVLNHSDSPRAHRDAVDETRDAVIEFIGTLDQAILEHGLGEPDLMTLPEKVDILRAHFGEVPVDLTDDSENYFNGDRERIKESLLEQAESVGLTCS